MATSLDDVIYQLIHKNETINESRQSCASLEGALAKISSQEVQDHIAELMSQEEGDYWFDASDDTNEDDWLDSDGVSLFFTNWDVEPNNNIDKNCALIRYKTNLSICQAVGVIDDRDYWFDASDDANEDDWLDSDGVFLFFTNWDVEPNNNINKNCALIRSSVNHLWVDEDCNRRHYYICQFEVWDKKLVIRESSSVVVTEDIPSLTDVTTSVWIRTNSSTAGMCVLLLATESVRCLQVL
uniref:Uncharacterized protein LOC102804502 n=1 Tax=Saccoglossus kowalevskii TaxID=10224 RepID=A0ABM0M1B9_SACKO|nr:PREDICTED: uncharacterized protein LOC102804502 [Saccoglossus kowalevskii]